MKDPKELVRASAEIDRHLKHAEAMRKEYASKLPATLKRLQSIDHLTNSAHAHLAQTLKALGALRGKIDAGIVNPVIDEYQKVLAKVVRLTSDEISGPIDRLADRIDQLK